MRVDGDERAPGPVGRVQVEGMELRRLTKRGARQLLATDHLLLLAHRARIPVLDGDVDPTHDEIRPAPHPAWALRTGPHEFLELATGGIDRPVLEALQISRRARARRGLVEPNLSPTDRRDPVRDSLELTY